MKTKIYFFILLQLISLSLFGQEYLVCEVSDQPAEIKYANGEQVNEGDVLDDEKILILSKLSKMLLINKENKEVYACHGEGEYSVKDLIKGDNSRRTSEFFKYVRDLWLGRLRMDQAGVVYRDNPELESLLAGCIDSTGFRGIELSFVDSYGKEINTNRVGINEIFYFVVKNTSEYPLFINILKKERDRGLKNCCECDEMRARLELIVPGNSEVLISEFPQIASEKQLIGYIVLGSDKFIDAGSIIYNYGNNQKLSEKDIRTRYNYFFYNN